MSTVAFLGLGHMGSRMAARLVAAGHEVTTWNRTPRRLAGARAATTPADAVAGAEFVLTMLTGPEAVEAVLFGDDGAAPAMTPHAVLVELSTIGPRAVAAIAARLPCPVVDAPVGGSIDRAEAGELIVLAGGAESDVDRVAPVLAALGDVRRTGGSGSAAAAKLVLNAAMVGGLALLGEVRELAAALGVDPEPLLGTGPLAMVAARAGATGVHFGTELAVKDLDLAIRHGDRLPLLAAARDRADTQPTGQDAGALADPRSTR
ncbi:NAD(P)-dependent oxidoreductase [Actinophytocola gossypii]|uniref:NAD(P)-dependent oxidoreductase n=1 Tax=Actinophytocola gossypii TaxID=2812003 RepID=A0ABT2J9B3_9PSEU|nr:NAD(P)-dependent oxidoreductase [Actinophytocola gossypii]MCT2584164.1 NAD(P)-dependent oxidoreductase [Actinophytocola gossypii]